MGTRGFKSFFHKSYAFGLVIAVVFFLFAMIEIIYGFTNIRAEGFTYFYIIESILAMIVFVVTAIFYFVSRLRNKTKISVWDIAVLVLIFASLIANLIQFCCLEILPIGTGFQRTIIAQNAGFFYKIESLVSPETAFPFEFDVFKTQFVYNINLIMAILLIVANAMNIVWTTWRNKNK